MRKIYILLLFSLITTTSLLAQKTISGVVITSEDNSPLIGVSVTVKGATRGVLTDINGKYSIQVSNNETLVFSYIGMNTEQVAVANQTVINVTLNPNSKVLDEVVVTAMGIKTEKKKLNFAVQSVNSESITEGQQANFINGLQGKVSGVNVTNSGGSPNSGSLLIIRGISSINSSQSNAPLYILDGIAFSGAVSDINPNDIENVTVLKGAAAAALYGQSGANGAIMITTKQGTAGKTSVSANVSFQRNDAVRTPELQTMYGPGALGFYKPEASGGSGGWGPLLSSGTQTYDNIKNYFKTGFYQKYDVSMSGGTDKVKFYASGFYSNDKGIIVNDYLTKSGILVKGSAEIGKKVTLSAMANIVNDVYRGGSGVSSAYLWPLTDDIRNYQESNGFPRFRYLSEKEKTDSPISPLFSRYNDYGRNNNTRNIMQASINYKAFKDFEAIGRFNYEINNYSYDGYSVPRFDDSKILANPPVEKSYPDTPEGKQQYIVDFNNYTNMYNQTSFLNLNDYNDMDKDLLGKYSNSNSSSKQLTALGLLSYKLNLPKEISLNFIAGGELKTYQYITSSVSNRDFIVPGIYNLGNTNFDYFQKSKDVSVAHKERRNAGIFTEIKGDYKGLASLGATYRMDWSSTLTQEYSPYQYPSITGGVIFSEIFKLTNNWFNFGKLRGNWARVGKDAPSPYLFDRKYVQYPTLPDGGYGVDPSASIASLLKPEMSDSWEVGLETRMFNNKTRLDLAYYSTTVNNQIVTVRVSPASGYILQTRNEGSIKNYGVEFIWEQDILRNKNFQWKSILTYGFNRGTVVSLPDDIVEVQGTQYDNVFPTAYLHGSTTALSGKDYARTDDGKVIVNADGYPTINPTKSVLIGNREPDFLMGLNNSFTYKGFNLAFLIDGRKGGDVFNYTSKSLWTNGQAKAIEFYRGRQVVWDGVVKQADGTYVKNTTPIVLDYNAIINYYALVSSNFIEDGSYIRLNYVTVGYDFMRLIKNKKMMNTLKASITASNLLLLTKYTGSDPQINADTSSGGTGGMGIDSYPVPSTRGFNFTITATF